MAISAAVLAEGQAPSSKTTVYTSPTSTKTYIKSAIFNNTSGGSVTITMYVKRATSRTIAKAVLAAGDSFYFNESVILEAADIIELQATSGASVDYWISGAKEA